MAGSGEAMEAIFLAWLISRWRSIRRRTYTPEQLDAIKREVAQREGRPLLEDQRKPYKWWKFYWF